MKNGYEHRKCDKCELEIGFNKQAEKIELGTGWLCSDCAESLIEYQHILTDFAEKILAEQKPIDADIAKIMSERFWDMHEDF